MKRLRFLLPVLATLSLAGSAAAATIFSPSTTVFGGVSDGTTFTVGAVGTTAGGNNWPEAEPPADLVNGILGGGGEKYLNFARVNTGALFMPSAPSIARTLTLWVANDAEGRDPASYILYGTNAAIAGTPTTLPISTFTQISSGALALPATRDTTADATGFSQSVTFPNTTAYASYLLVFPTTKSATENSMQISEVQLDTTVIPEAGVPVSLVLAAVVLAARRRRRRTSVCA